MSNSKVMKNTVPSVVLAKINPPVPAPKNLVFKKASRDKSIVVYLEKRDFVDHVTHVDPVDGVLVLDTGYIRPKRVYCRLICAFRYGPEDMDVCGLKFQRDLFVSTVRVFPPPSKRKSMTQTKMQERLIRKFGHNAYAFNFEFPDYLPCSITLQAGPSNPDKCCGVDFQIHAFSAKFQKSEERITKRSSVRLVIRKVQFAPDKPDFQPMVKIIRHFLMSDEPLHLAVSLNKEIYYHNEPIQVSVEVMNFSNKTVKKINITVEQISNVVLYSNDKYTKIVAMLQVRERIAPGSKHKKEYTLLPLIENNRDKHGVALDGKIKDEDTQLASSTILKEGIERTVWGILVSYKVKVKLVVSGILGDISFSDVAVEIPFLHMNPDPQIQTEDMDDDEIQFEDFSRRRPMAVVEDLKDAEESPSSDRDI